MSNEKRDDEITLVAAREELEVLEAAGECAFADLDAEAHRPLDRALTKIQRALKSGSEA